MSKFLLFVLLPSAQKSIIQDCSIPFASLTKETAIVTPCKAKLSPRTKEFRGDVSPKVQLDTAPTQANAQSAQPQIEPSTIESDLLKTNKNIATQSREILQTFVWREASSCPHPTKTYKRLKNSRL